MAGNITDDAVEAVEHYTYDRISAHEGLEELQKKVEEFKQEKKFTLIQEKKIIFLKKEVLKKVRDDQPYVFMKKLKAFKWVRPITDQEMAREIDLDLDLCDMNYVMAQNQLNRPYNKKEAGEIRKVVFDDSKHMMMEKLQRPDKPFPVKYNFSQELNEIQISERIEFYKMQVAWHEGSPRERGGHGPPLDETNRRPDCVWCQNACGY